MKNSRSFSIIRLSLTFSAALLWACSGGEGVDSLSQDIGASSFDATGTSSPPNSEVDASVTPPSDAGQGQGADDVTTIGKDDTGSDDNEDAGTDDDASDPAGGDVGPGEEDAGTSEDPDATETSGSDDGDTTGDKDASDPGDEDAGDDPGGDASGDPLDDSQVSPDEDASSGGDEDAGPDEDGSAASEDGAGDDPDDAESEPDVVIDEGPFACEGDEGCDDQGATRCAEEGGNLIQECKAVGGCLKWLDSAYCEFDDLFTNACTGKADICLAGECVPDGDLIVECPTSDNPCEVPMCNGATGECTLMMVEPGTPCDDGDVCTKSDICFGAECIGSGEDALGSPICPQDCLDSSAEIACGEFASFELNGNLGSALMDEYSCGGATGYTGYETAFLIEAPNQAYEMPLVVAVELADPALKGEAFADIIVLNTSTGYQCYANECVDVGYMDETGVATVELPGFVDEDADASNDNSYIILVDGRDGFSGAVRLATWCVPGFSNIELYCTDGADNNGAGGIDCDDPSCWDSLTCLFEHDCDNGSDDDLDGAVDCADNDCAEHPDCYVESNCSDGVDDEGDGFTDCEDSDCEFTPSCAGVCEGAVPLGCGDVLLGQDPATGSNTFVNFPCSPSGPNTESVDYTSPHIVYHLQADEGCSARVQVVPVKEDNFAILDIYAMGPGCSADHCIDIAGNADCQNPGTPASVFGGDACVQVPENFASSAWLTVIPDNALVGGGTDLTYGLEVLCDCQ